MGITVVGLASSSASAAPSPPPATSTDPLQQFKDLSAQSTKLDEDYLAAQNDLTNKQGQLQKANADLGVAKQAEQKAQATEEQFRGQVDKLTVASFEGARFNQLSALLTGTSVQDFLDRASMLQNLAQDNDAALSVFAGATKQADVAQKKALTAESQSQAATDAATKLVTAVATQKQALQAQIAQVQAAVDKLTASQRSTLNNVGNTGVFIGPAGAINTAMQAALSKRGDPYVWGASGPGSFDCSGLTMWSYGQAGVNLPHSARAQYDIGQSVPSGAWQPGDLLFYGSSASSIHHVAMYVGGGQIVQAPTEGVPVQVVPISGGGNDYYGAKRIVG